MLAIALNPLEIADRDPTGNKIGNTFERQMFPLMRLDAIKRLVENVNLP